MANEPTTPYTELMYQIETIIEDSEDDKHGALRMLKLTDMLNAAWKAAGAKRAKLLALRAGDTSRAQGYQELADNAIRGMRHDYGQMGKLIDKQAK